MVVVAAFVGAAFAEIADRLDEIAPEIECTKWAAGMPTQITKLRGRVVILHVSDPDRITSQAAVPPLRKLAKAWKDAPVSIVEVVTSPTESSATVYAAKDLPDWPVGWDSKGTTAARFPGTSVPRTYLIGPEGRIVWHAHVQSLTKEIVQAQVDRVQFFVPPPDVKRAKVVAKLAAEQKFGQALAEAAKAEAAKDATPADLTLCKAVRTDVETTWTLQKKVLDALIRENDWGIAWRRAERMAEMFAGTVHGPDAKAVLEELDAKPIVPYVRQAQKEYDGYIEASSKAKTKKDLEALVEKVARFVEVNEHCTPGARAKDLLDQLRSRLAALDAKK